MMFRFRMWLTYKLANAAIRVSPNGEEYRRKMGAVYHIGPGRRCPNDEAWT